MPKRLPWLGGLNRRKRSKNHRSGYIFGLELIRLPARASKSSNLPRAVNYASGKFSLKWLFGSRIIRLRV